jgi:DNA-binding transcriptional LysR family regulator
VRGGGKPAPHLNLNSGRNMPQLPDLEAWAIFAKVADLGSFSAAAQDLALSKATVSKAVARLEQRLGATLINRTSRRFALTETGRQSLERATRILADGEAVEGEIVELAREPRGLVRVSAPVSFGIQHLGPVLPDFLARFPEVSLDLALSDERIDLVGSGLDIALRIARLADSSLRARRLCAVRRVLVASPAYVAQVGAAEEPGDLERHDVVLFSHIAAPSQLILNHPQHGSSTVRIHSRITVNNADVVLPLLRIGQVTALVPEFLVWRELRAGDLVELLPGWTSELLALYAVMPPGTARPTRVSAFIDFCVEKFAGAPWVHDLGES